MKDRNNAKEEKESKILRYVHSSLVCFTHGILVMKHHVQSNETLGSLAGDIRAMHIHFKTA